MTGFQDIIGHTQIIAHLKNAILLDKVSHAYIFNGPEDSGKRMLAEAFAAALQCESVQKVLHQDEAQEQIRLFEMPAHQADEISDAARERAARGDACMECRSCRQAAGGNQPDILYVTHEKAQISVDDIRRQINRDIDVRPYSSKYKIYIVDEAEKMNVQAQNALLKTIEEPPAYAVILLLTTNADSFLPTIRSRCVSLNLKAVPDDEIRSFLMNRCQIPDYQADICVAFAQGNVGRAVKLASSDTFNERKDYTIQILRRLGDIPVYDLLTELEPWKEQKDDIQDFFDLLMLIFRDVLLYKASRTEEQLIFREQTYMIRQLSQKCSYARISEILKAIDAAQRRIHANVNFELTLELLLLSIKENLI